MDYMQRADAKVRELLDAIPGNANYNDLESRRDADRAVRQQVIDALSAAIDSVESVSRRYADDRRLETVSVLEETASRLRHARDRIRALGYGYIGLFSDNPVTAEALDALREYDRTLIGRVAGIVSRASALTTTTFESDADVQAASRAVTTEVETLLRSLSDRSRLIEVGEPPALPPPPSIEELLNEGPAVSHALESLAGLGVGAAAAVGNANYIVDAMIELPDSLSGTRAWRIQRDPEQWIIVTRLDGALRAFQVQSSDSTQSEGAKVGVETGAAILRTLTSERREPSINLMVTESSDADRPFVVQIAWKAHTQTFSGTEIPASSISVFGKPGR